MIRAAGMLLTTPGNAQALFIQRSADSDYPGTWCFPGGKIEDGETAEQAAEREVKEEVGPAPHANPTELTRRIGEDGVDFITFHAHVNAPFIPRLNAEHTGWTWADVATPPEPLHPGCRVALARLTMDELGVARAMAAGDLVSPQQYGKFWMFNIRITGTGLSYRSGLDEYVWRDSSLYLDGEFLARCNGLPVVFEHPDDKNELDSQEFNNRVVGTVFVPYIKGDEVWAVVKLWDATTITLLRMETFSTSPGVVFRASTSTNEMVTLANGDNLLIEGKPHVLDHIALVEAGVWDKGGPPRGVANDVLTKTSPSKEFIGMADENTTAADTARKDADEKLTKIMDAMSGLASRMDSMEAKRDSRARHDAARKDRFGGRKDGESYKDWGKRHDAAEAAMCDELCKGGESREDAERCAKDARKDAEEAERRCDAESFEKWAREEETEPSHKDARKDAEAEKEKDMKEEEARKDAAELRASNADLAARLARAEAVLSQMTTETPASERDALAAAQSRADSVAGMFGERASAPLPGEKALDYRRRLLTKFKGHSPKFTETRFDSLDPSLIDAVEDIVYNDAVAAARNPEKPAVGRLIPIVTRENGRDVTRFTGDMLAWMAPFMTAGNVGRVIRNPNMGI